MSLMARCATCRAILPTAEQQQFSSIKTTSELQKTILRLQDALRLREGQIECLRLKVDQIGRQLKQKKEEMAQLTAKVQQAQSKKKSSLSLEFNILRFIELPQEILAHHPRNYHKSYFIFTKNSDISANLIKKGGDQEWKTFVNAAPIDHKQKAKYRIRIIKAMQSAIWIGFCTSSGLGCGEEYYSSESLYYCCWGTFNDGGNYEDLTKSKEGDVITCEADMSEGVTRWWKNEVLIKEKGVQRFKGKPVFLSVIMYKNGDEVDLTA